MNNSLNKMNVHFCRNLKCENHWKAKRNMWELRNRQNDSVIGRNSDLMENYS